VDIVSVMPVEQPQTMLFTLDPFEVQREVLHLRGATSFTVADDVAAELKAIQGTENILALTVYVTCEGLKVLDGDLTWISTLVDVVLPD
jgi:hypothetical protein